MGVVGRVPAEVKVRHDALTQFGGRGTFSDAATLRAGLLRQSERISRLELELIERIDELSARLDAAEKRQSNPTG